MEEIIKVVIFHVDAPKNRKMLNTNVHSEEFEIDFYGKLSTWKLMCDFNDRNNGDIGIYLTFLSGDLPAKIQYTLGLINHIDSYQNKNSSSTKQGEEFVDKDETPQGWGCKSIISHKDLLVKRKEYFPKDKLRFVAKIIFKNESKEVIPTRSSQRLQKLFENMKHSDIVFKTFDEEEIKAHRLVLCTMSDVFDAMFSHETIERDSGIIDASDLHSDIVKDLIRFIYCEPTFRNLKTAMDKEIELYYAAEKYNLKELKIICLNEIYSKLDEFNVLEIVTFAKTFNLKDLFSCCLLIILANFKSLSESIEWKDLKADEKVMILEHVVENSENFMKTKSTWYSNEF